MNVLNHVSGNMVSKEGQCLMRQVACQGFYCTTFNNHCKSFNWLFETLEFELGGVI